MELLKATAVYDNTVFNDLNPNDPPITVYDGALTTDEMVLVYFIYANYQEGDEDIILDPDLITSVERSPEFNMNLYPNPASDEITIELPADWKSVHVRILDVRGALVREIYQLDSRDRIPVDDLPSATYNLEIISESGGSLTRPFVKR